MIDITNTPRIRQISEYSGFRYIFVMSYSSSPLLIIFPSDPSMMAELGGFGRIVYWEPVPRVAFLGTFGAFL